MSSEGYQISEIFPGPGVDGGASANCVTSFNGRNGQVILNSQDVVDALGYVPGAGGSGTGDMTKAVYDPDDNGIVDHAALADSAPWAGITGKPTTFPPSAHNHTVADVTALQAALDGKAAIGHGHAIADVTSLQAALDGKAALAHGHAVGDVTGLQSALDAKAPLASPALTGAPTAPTAATGTNTTQLSTTAFVQAAIAALVNSAPGALDTLNELAAALGNDPNFAATITNALAGKQPLDADLTALAGLTTTGFAVRTGAGTWAAQALLAADIPDLDAAKITSGTFNLARIAGLTNAQIAAGAAITLSKLAITGVPDGTKFLRDDGSWQAVAGGGSGTINNGTAKRLAHYAATGTTLSDTPGLEFQSGASPNLRLIAAGPTHTPLQLDLQPSQVAPAFVIKNSAGDDHFLISSSGWPHYLTLRGAYGPNGVYLSETGIRINDTGYNVTFNLDINPGNSTAIVYNMKHFLRLQLELGLLSSTPPAITGNQNDYAIVPQRSIVRLSSNANLDITGFAIGQGDGHFRLVINTGAFVITLKHENVNSVSTNRLLNSTGADIALSPNQAAIAWYDASSARWRVFKQN